MGEEMGELPLKSGRLSARVVDLAAYRLRRNSGTERKVFYIHEHGKLLPELQDFNFLKIEEISSAQNLNTKLALFKPDVIFLEAALKWTDPFQLLEELRSQVTCPIVLICDRKRSLGKLIKRAYRLGVFDILFTPLVGETLKESLNILLRVPHASLIER